jgi:hypothetical protein
MLVNLLTPVPFAVADKLKIDDIRGGDRVVVLVYARKEGDSGCALREVSVARSTGELSLGNRIAGCAPWVAILSTNNAMKLATPAWTPAADDERSVSLQPVIDVPVRVWIARPDAVDARKEAMDHMANANLLFEKNKVGIQFDPKYERVSAEAVPTIEGGFKIDDEDDTYRCRNLRQVQRSGFYVRKTLNVYYINQAATGRNCAITRGGGDGNIIYIGTAANRATLTHEFGHAFGLRPGDAGGHTEENPDFTSGNIMAAGGTGRRHLFSAGQVFRMNTYNDERHGTMLLKNGHSTGAGRNCPPLTTNTNCPDLAVDWDRP